MEIMESKFTLGVHGIGDIIFFISFINKFHNKSGVNTYIDFSKEGIKGYRNDVETYYPFMVDFAKLLIPTDNIIIQEGIQGQTIDSFQIFQYYLNHFTEFKVVDLRPKFNSERDSSKIVINTKVRGLYRHQYNLIKNKFYQILNESDKQFIILGEKEVEYGKEYQIHGDQIIYSIYNDIINNISKDKIIDLTIPKYGISSPDFSNLMKDMDIISKHKNICFGVGGTVFLCQCLCDSDLRICAPESDFLTQFLDKRCRKSILAFVEELPEFLKN
jgi:hypothetical protein